MSHPAISPGPARGLSKVSQSNRLAGSKVCQSKRLADFSNPREVLAQAILICLDSRQAAVQIPDGNLRFISTARKEAKRWIEALDSHIGSYPPSDALHLLTPYDYLYRLAYNSAPLPGVMTPHILRAFEAMIRGDRDIDKYELYRHIMTGVEQRDPFLHGRPLKWTGLQLTRWLGEIKEKIKEGISSEVLTDEALKALPKVCALLESDLSAYEGRKQDGFKQQLIEKYLPLVTTTLSAISDYSEDLPKVLIYNISNIQTLRHFLFLARPRLSDADSDRYQTLLTALLSEALSALPLPPVDCRR